MDTRECNYCGVHKPYTDFYARDKSKGIYRYRCKACEKKTYGNGDRNKHIVKARRAHYKQQAVDYKGGCCSVCGYSKCLSALEFHHPDPTTKVHKGGLAFRRKALEHVKEELDNTVLLCANCHRETHERLHITKEEEN